MILGVKKRQEEKKRPRHAVFTNLLLFSLWSWVCGEFVRNSCSGAAERPSPSFDPHSLERRMCRRNDVEKGNLTLPDMSVNEIWGIGMEIHLCNSMAEGHSLDIWTQTQEENHPCLEYMTFTESRAAYE